MKIKDRADYAYYIYAVVIVLIAAMFVLFPTALHYITSNLHQEARSGNDWMVKVFLRMGHDVNQKNESNHKTPLHDAVDEWNTTTMELLIDREADIKAKTKNGHTPLHIAMLSLKDRRQTDTGVIFVHGPCNPDAVEILLDAGADPNERVGEKGRTAFQLALTQQCREEVIKMLIEAGAQPHLTVEYDPPQNPNIYTWTSVHFAAVYGSPDVFEMVVKASDYTVYNKTNQPSKLVDVKDNFGNTAMDILVGQIVHYMHHDVSESQCSRYKEKFRILARAGADTTRAREVLE
ncbi:ankyrin repeat domain-containing protein, partial [Thermoproteota archaeon]